MIEGDMKRLLNKRSRVRGKTMTIPEAARELGIGRNSAYAAAKRGEIPTIRIGSRILVPCAAFERMVG